MPGQPEPEPPTKPKEKESKPSSMFDGLAKASGIDEESKNNDGAVNESLVSEDLD